MKSLIVILLIAIYCISMSMSLYYVGNNIVDRPTIGLLTHVPMLFLMLGVLLLRNLTKNNATEKQLYMIADFMIISFLFLYCANNLGMLPGVTKKLLFFNGLNIALIIIVLTNGFKHGIFKKK